jgi:hypothetical protein
METLSKHRKYTVTRDSIVERVSSPYKWVSIKNNRTGEVVRYYEAEFVRGQMHHDPNTDSYPAYVHMEVFRLCKN